VLPSSAAVYPRFWRSPRPLLLSPGGGANPFPLRLARFMRLPDMQSSISNLNSTWKYPDFHSFISFLFFSLLFSGAVNPHARCDAIKRLLDWTPFADPPALLQFCRASLVHSFRQRVPFQSLLFESNRFKRHVAAAVDEASRWVAA